MLSPGQIAYRGFIREYPMAVCWTELTEEEQQRWQDAGREVVGYYARIMNAEPNVLLDQMTSRLTALEEFANDVCQEIKIKGRWREFPGG